MLSMCLGCRRFGAWQILRQNQAAELPLWSLSPVTEMWSVKLPFGSGYGESLPSSRSQAIGWSIFLHSLYFLLQGRLLLPHQPRGMPPRAVFHVPQPNVHPGWPRAAEDRSANPGATPLPLHRPSGCCQVQVSTSPQALLLQSPFSWWTIAWISITLFCLP